MDNFVIEVLDLEHGQEVKKYFQSIGIYKNNKRFSSNRKDESEHRFYGLYNGEFDCYTLNFIQLEALLLRDWLGQKSYLYFYKEY